MPKISETQNTDELVARLIELVAQAEGVLAEVKEQLEKSPHKDPLGIKVKDQKNFADLCAELAGADAQIKKHKAGEKDASLCQDLILQCKAKLSDIRLRTGQKLESIDADYVPAGLPLDRMPELILAYRTDTRMVDDGNVMWGGDLEAHHGATLLGFYCNVFVVANGRLRRVTTVGDAGGIQARHHLLHSGNHYEVLTYDAQDNDVFNANRVRAIAKDGHCLYNSLSRIAAAQFLRVPSLAGLRHSVAQRLDDEDIRIALIAITLSGNYAGLGPNLSQFLDAAAEDASKFVSSKVDFKAKYSKETQEQLELLQGLSLLMLGYAKSRKGESQEVQAMNLDGQIIASSNFKAETTEILTAFQRGRPPSDGLEAMNVAAARTLNAMDGGSQRGNIPLIAPAIKQLSRLASWVSRGAAGTAENWFDGKAPRQLHILDGTGELHAEQNLLLALARRLHQGLVPDRPVFVAGVKPPCATCRRILFAFASAYFEVYNSQIVFNLDPGRSDKGKGDLDLSKIEGEAKDKRFLAFSAAYTKYLKKF